MLYGEYINFLPSDSMDLLLLFLNRVAIKAGAYRLLILASRHSITSSLLLLYTGDLVLREYEGLDAQICLRVSINVAKWIGTVVPPAFGIQCQQRQQYTLS